MSVSRVVGALEGAGVAVGPFVPAGRAVGRVRIAGVQHDSRRVGPGDLFVAWSGAVHDAHRYVTDAAASGAAAAIVEHPVAETVLPQIQVDNARLAAAVASGFVAGSPWRTLRTAGVTGTNGKTTTALLLRGLLARKAPAAAIGTLGVVGPAGGVREGTGGLTTPGPVELAGRMSSLAREGVREVVVESSSHALDQFRLDAIRFDVMAFTNLTPGPPGVPRQPRALPGGKGPPARSRQGGGHGGDQRRRTRVGFAASARCGDHLRAGPGCGAAGRERAPVRLRIPLRPALEREAQPGGTAAAGGLQRLQRAPARPRVRWRLAMRSTRSPPDWARRPRCGDAWSSWRVSHAGS